MQGSAQASPASQSTLDKMLAQVGGGIPAMPDANPVGVKPTTAPADVPQATSQSGWGGILDVYKSVGGMTPNQYSGEADKILKQVDAANAPAIQGIEKGIGQRKAIMSQPIPRPAPPQLQGMPAAPDTKMKDPLNVFQNVGTVLAMLGSAFTRRPMVTAMNAASAAIKGYADGDKDAAERAHNSWKDSLQAAISQNQAEMDQYNTLLEDTKISYQDREAQLQAIAASNNDLTMQAALKSGSVDKAFDILNGRQAAAGKLTDLLIQSQQHDEQMAVQKQQMAMEQERIAESERHNQAMEGGGMGDPDDVANMIASGKMAPLTSMAMRSPWGREVMSRVKDINPQFDGTTYQVRQKARRDFATGTQGNTVRSLNVAISHLNTLDGLAKALKNGDVQSVNKWSQLFQQETGATAPTNFDAAKSIVGDEVVKAIVGSGGALADREDAQDKISKTKNWEQLSGATATYRKLMAGQLKGLKQQYGQNTGLDDFDDMLSDETKTELEGESAGANDAQEGDTVQQNGHTYKFTGGNWVAQ